VAVDGRRLSVWNSMKFDLKSSVPVPASKFLGWTGLTGDVQIGDKLRLIPPRLCTALDLYDWMYVVQDNRVVDVWKVAARGKRT